MNSRVVASLILFVVFHADVVGQGTTTVPRGLRVKCDGASPGYTLFAPLGSDTTYLIDLDGRVVRTWKSAFLPSAWVYLLDNGHLLRGGSEPGTSGFGGGGSGGRFQEFDFDGKLVWDFSFNQGRLPHHDVAVLPNGNILAIVWEGRTADEARRAGRREGFIPSSGIWPDMLIEFEPQPPNGARIVWEWHMWDHLIQNIDSTRDNYGDPALHPERIDINGDTAGASAPLNPTRDVFHTNAVAYNPDFDQILLSVPTFNEVWVIDHSTTTQQAATVSGGRSGKGGDLLYRWGNPQAYGRGLPEDRLLGFQHNAHWIPQGRPGAGHMMVFSNRTPSANGTYAKVYEFIPPVDDEGRYAVPESGPFGPAAAVWSYAKPDSFQAIQVSGAERLKNGNTLISSGPQGRLFEVTPAGDIVWEYWSPYSPGSSFILFRAIKFLPDHPAVKGRNLQPLDPQPSISPFAFVSPGSGVCPTPVVTMAPDLSIESSHTGNFGAGVDATYTVTVRNEGTGPTSGTISVTDTLPPGLTFVSGMGTGWSCSALGQVVTCTNSAVLAASVSTRYTVTVAVRDNAAPTVKHTVSVMVDGDLNAENDSSSNEAAIVTASPTVVFRPVPLIPGQPASIAVNLATPFPHDVTGSVTATFVPDATSIDDPAIQFETGGRTAAFTIPAHSVEARFGSGLQSGPLGFQTGTLAGTLTFAGTFTAGATQGDLFPPHGTEALIIPPNTLSIQRIQTNTQGGFTISILLFSTSREVTQLSLSFNTSPKIRLSCGANTGCSAFGNTLTLDVSPMFAQWFNGSAAFGGLAQLRLPLDIQGGAVRGTVAVTLRSSQGESLPVSFTLP